MHFKRLLNEREDIFFKCVALYKTSFPDFEQRSDTAQKAVLRCNDYHFDVIYDEDEFVGLMLYWETSSFVYVEHFCIDTTKRNNGCGKRALSLLVEKNKTIILEIDPPLDELSVRRKNFYLKAGFNENPFEHIHPPYKQNFQGHTLVVLSYPNVIDDEDFSSFNSYLESTVMSHI